MDGLSQDIIYFIPFLSMTIIYILITIIFIPFGIKPLKEARNSKTYPKDIYIRYIQYHNLAKIWYAFDGYVSIASSFCSLMAVIAISVDKTQIAVVIIYSAFAAIFPTINLVVGPKRRKNRSREAWIIMDEAVNLFMLQNDNEDYKNLRDAINFAEGKLTDEADE